MRSATACLLALTVLLVSPCLAGGQEEAFWDAAREGDLAAIKKLNAAGVDVNARTRYGATALSYACDRGHTDVVRYLVDRGADVNTKDEFYEFTPLGWSLYNDHLEITKILMAAGAEGADQVLTTGVQKGNKELVSLALASEEITGEDVARALEQARAAGDSEEIVALLEAADVAPVEKQEVTVPLEVLETYVGTFDNKELGITLHTRLEDGALVLQPAGDEVQSLRVVAENRFELMNDPGASFTFQGRGGIIEALVLEQRGQTLRFGRVDEETAGAGGESESAEPEKAPMAVAAAPEVVERQAPRNWPSFRGNQASGVSDGQGAPLAWNLETGENVRWKTPIPGLANSSPVVWKDRIFVTTAISGAGNNSLRTGVYGDVDSVEDDSEHTFKVYALSMTDGAVLWEKTVARQVPGAKRHLKSTQANSTPVTDGKHVVALFGTVGLLAAFDMDGKQLWQTDVGVLDSGWFYDRGYSWGHASSPVIHDGLVIVQADVYADAFIAAYSLADGKQVWKTSREAIPSWGTPTVYQGEKGAEIVTNGPTIRGYDLKTGKELWHLTPNSEVTVATPVIAHDMIYVTAGYPPARPIYVIRPGARGDISLPEGASSSKAIAWSKDKGGTYMPTPIVYGDYLYTCANNGRLTAYDARTGEEVYRQRLESGGGAFTASPVASDGRIYFTSEDGDIIVAKAGPVYEELARNEMGEVCMSTPAISNGLLVVRTAGHVVGLGAPLEDAAAR